MTETLLAVYEDSDRARAVADELVRRGLPNTRVMVDRPDDARRAVVAEMEAEVADSWASPGIGALVTKEMLRGAVVFMVVLGAIGFVLGAPLGWLAFDPAWSLWRRLLVGAGIGSFFCGTVGALLGGGLAVRPSNEPLAGEVGVPVRVDGAGSDALRLLAEFEPLRIDRIAYGERRGTPTTAGPGGVTEALEQAATSARDPSRR